MISASSLSDPGIEDSLAMRDTTEHQRVSSLDSFTSAMETPEAPSPVLFRPSADEWYPRVHIGWNYAANVDVFCYFKMDNRDPEIQWAIHRLGPPFLGRPDLSSFDPTPRLVNIDFYLRQDRFQFGTPIYERDEYLGILELWEKKELDINIPGNITDIQEAIKVKFQLDVSEERVKLLTNLTRFKFSPSVFQTHDWQHMLCHNSRPSINHPVAPNRKRKSRDGSTESVEVSPIKEPTVPTSEILRKSLIISRWLRRELDDVSPHLQTIQEFLKTTYGIEEEDATPEKIRKMTETADSSESPLASRTCRGLAAEATTEVMKGIMPLRGRSTSLRSTSLSLPHNPQTTSTPATRNFSVKLEDVEDLYHAD